jgi:hypothetical protein
MFFIRAAIAALIVSALAGRALASDPLYEFLAGQEKLEGKVIAHNDAAYWLVGQEGRLRVLTAGEVKKYRKISPQFQGWSPSIVKDQLRREFSRPYDVASTRHYVVVAKGEAKARQYADILESFFGTFRTYFSLRGFQVPEPEFPLIAIVFPSQEAFAKYAQQERQRVSRMVRGYYMPTSNRIAFFEEDGDSVALAEPALPPGRDLPERSLAREVDDEAAANVTTARAWDSIEASLKDTLIHEATHQAAYNTGLHSRICQTPVWMVEGLATVFEAPGIRTNRANTGIKSRINPERFAWFREFAKERRQPRSLESFVAHDDLFGSNTLDAYSQAWAVTFFLFETRPRNYAEYLQTVADREPLEIYTPEARVADFEAAIGKEMKLLEAEFLRFMAEIR